MGSITRRASHGFAHANSSPPASVMNPPRAAECPVWSSTKRWTSVSCSALNTSRLARLRIRIERGVLERLRSAKQHDVVDLTLGQRRHVGSVADATGLGAARPVLAARGDDRAQRQREPAGVQQLAATERGPLNRAGHDSSSGRSGSAVLTSNTSRSSPRPDRSARTTQWRASIASIEATSLAPSTFVEVRQQLGVGGHRGRLEVVPGGRHRGLVGRRERGFAARRTPRRYGCRRVRRRSRRCPRAYASCWSASTPNTGSSAPAAIAASYRSRAVSSSD